MPQFENPYVNPFTVEHHNLRHLPGGLDPLTGESLFVGQPPLSIEHGGTGFDFDDLNCSSYPGILRVKKFFGFGLGCYLGAGGEPLDPTFGGTGFRGLNYTTPENLQRVRDFFDIGLWYTFGSESFYEGCEIGTGIPVDCGGTGCTDETQLEVMIGTKFLSGYDTNCLHAVKHAIGGTDVITPADIGAALATHSHAGYLEATFDDATNHLTIGAKTFDLTSLLVP